MSFNAIPENKILAKLSESTVYDFILFSKESMYGCSTDRAKLNSLCFICSLGQVKKKLWTSTLSPFICPLEIVKFYLFHTSYYIKNSGAGD